jgi:protein dithiol:quinone oxidoreductase
MNAATTLDRSPAASGRFTHRTWLALTAALAAGSMAAALVLQYVYGLAPCPLCVMQRVAIIAAGLAAVAGLLLPLGVAAVAASLVSALFALAGAGIATWHSWLVAYPPESMSCGRPFEWFHEEFPLATWLPRLFRGDGDCLANDWSLLGLNVPNLALLTFVLLIALALAAARAGSQRTSATRN